MDIYKDAKLLCNLSPKIKKAENSNSPQGEKLNIENEVTL